MFRGLVNLGYFVYSHLRGFSALQQVGSGIRIPDYIECCLLRIEDGDYSNKMFRRCLEHGLNKEKTPKSLATAFHKSSIDEVIKDLRAGNELKFWTEYGKPRDLIIAGVN